MTQKTIQLEDTLHEYILQNTLNEPELFCQLRQETAQMKNANMQIAPEQGQFMALLIRLIGAERALEVGTFTGYSALWVASALPEEGLLLACDVNEEWTGIAGKYWKKAGLSHKIQLRLAPASETLEELVSDPTQAPFDFAFIDADKTGYDDYYEKALRLLRKGGLIAFDNALQHGRVADEKEQGENTVAIRKLNLKIRDDDRVDSCLVPIGDGLLLARKR
jgi:predicted O-methyltransferase YrrM